jgi:hypothetical protein
MASTASGKVAVAISQPLRGDLPSGPDRALQFLACGNNLAPVVMTAMAANMVRPLQLAAVRTLGMRLVRQRVMAAPHALS